MAKDFWEPRCVKGHWGQKERRVDAHCWGLWGSPGRAIGHDCAFPGWVRYANLSRTWWPTKDGHEQQAAMPGVTVGRRDGEDRGTLVMRVRFEPSRLAGDCL